MAEQAFSIAIACSHSADCLSSTLQALAELDYPKGFEVLVIDDGRREGREDAAVAAKTAGLSIHYLSAPGIGRASAWNVAIHEAGAENLAFLDDGCVPSPDWLQVYDNAFDEWTAGVIGGPDRALKNAGVWERSLDYVLNSFVGSLGLRTGRAVLGRYYPRPWNMAARTEALRLAGGFGEHAPVSPEVPMISRLIRLAFKASFEPNAVVGRRRETGPLKLVARDFRLGAERGRGIAPPGVRRAYAAGLIALLCVIATAWAGGRIPGREIVFIALGAYGAALAFSGAHSAILTKSPAVAVLTPALMAAHHVSHLAGYIFGLLSKAASSFARAS